MRRVVLLLVACGSASKPASDPAAPTGVAPVLSNQAKHSCTHAARGLSGATRGVREPDTEVYDDLVVRCDRDGWPVTAEKYARWVGASDGTSVNVFLDYETFGEHQWEETGIFEFLAHLPGECAGQGVGFVQPGELALRRPEATLSFDRPTSWADVERDTSAWLGNRIQVAAHERLYALKNAVIASGDPERMEDWRRLTTSDHVYYMCTKWFADGDVHKYFSPFDSPYDAFIAFMNAAQDLSQRVAGQPAGRPVVEDWPLLAGMACVA